MKRIGMLCLVLLLSVSFSSMLQSHVHADVEDDMQDELIYDILVDRYINGDQAEDDTIDIDDPYAFHGGDLNGILGNLDDIEELGFTTILLSPLMKNSPDGYHGFWVEDFFALDEHYGSMDDLDELIEEAHERDIKVVMEFGTSYIGPTHPIAEDADRQDWVTDVDGMEELPWMDETLKLDQTNPEVQEMLMEAADHWMSETDLDGFKLQAVDKADPSFMQDFTEHVKEQDPGFLLFAGVLEPGADVDYIADDEHIDLVENTDLHKVMTDTFSQMDTPVSDVLEEQQSLDDDRQLLYLDNEYTERFTQKFSKNGRNSLTTWKLALTYMYSVPGVPVIYQGSSVPMYGGGIPESQRMVQFNSRGEDLQEFFHKISELRKEFPALTDGSFEVVDSSNGMSVFKRQTSDETVFTAINNGSESQAIPVTDVESGKELRGLLEDDIVREDEDGTFMITLPRETADVYITEEDTGLNWVFIALMGGIFLLFPIFITIISIQQKRRKKQQS